MGVVIGDPGAVDGESHHGDGPIMLTWASFRREAATMRFGRDVVLHEFAHKLDSRDGVVDGTPLIPEAAARQRWIDVCTAEYEAVRAGRSVLRTYAGTNPGEFFAVATEAFFTVPLDLRSLQPDLYDVVTRGRMFLAAGDPTTAAGMLTRAAALAPTDRAVHTDLARGCFDSAQDRIAHALDA